MKIIYYISGIGADERVYKYLNLGYTHEKHIKWIAPRKNENLQEYCIRLIPQFDLSNEIILVGVSFGGIIAQEIAKIITVNKIIIISSIKTAKELDWQFNCIRLLKLYKAIPLKYVKSASSVIGPYYFGVQTEAELTLLKLILEDTDNYFLKWAVGAMMQWDNGTHPNVVHIHGDKDRVFPIKNISNAIIIHEGGHFMIVNRAKEIADIIKKEIY